MITFKQLMDRLIHGKDALRVKEFWNDYLWGRLEPELKAIQIRDKQFSKMVLGEPRIIQNSRQNPLIKSHISSIAITMGFPVNAEEWGYDSLNQLSGKLEALFKKSEFAIKNWRLIYIVQQPHLSYAHTNTEKQDLVITLNVVLPSSQEL